MNPRRASIEAELALIEGAREQRAREAVAALRAERAQQESVRVEIEAAGGERRKALDPLSASVRGAEGNPGRSDCWGSWVAGELAARRSSD